MLGTHPHTSPHMFLWVRKVLAAQPVGLLGGSTLLPMPLFLLRASSQLAISDMPVRYKPVWTRTADFIKSVQLP